MLTMSDLYHNLMDPGAIAAVALGVTALVAGILYRANRDTAASSMGVLALLAFAAAAIADYNYYTANGAYYFSERTRASEPSFILNATAGFVAAFIALMALRALWRVLGSRRRYKWTEAVLAAFVFSSVVTVACDLEIWAPWSGGVNVLNTVGDLYEVFFWISFGLLIALVLVGLIDLGRYGIAKRRSRKGQPLKITTVR